MKIKDIALSAAYVGQMVVKAICVGAQEVWSAVKYIVFKDKAVEQICVANFSSDGVGVTEEDAAKVTDIGTKFKGNTEITSFEERKYFGGAASGSFDGCSSLQSIDLSRVSSVDIYGFRGCTSLVNLCTNLSNITRIGSSAFEGCTSLVIDVDLSSVSDLGFYAFQNSGIKRVVSMSNNTTELKGSVFAGCKNLVSVQLPSSIVKLSDYTFGKCTMLNPRDMLMSCPNLTTLDTGLFNDCKSPYFTEIKIPSSVTTIGAVVFRYCLNLTKVILMSSAPPSVADNSFIGTHATLIFYVPDESVEAYKTASNWSTYADRIEPMSKYVES